MAEQRSLTIRVQIDGLTVAQEDQVLADVRAYLAKVPGTTRPDVQVNRASREAIALAP